MPLINTIVQIDVVGCCGGAIAQAESACAETVCAQALLLDGRVACGHFVGG
jgi:hypothetical protein